MFKIFFASLFAVALAVTSVGCGPGDEVELEAPITDEDLEDFEEEM